MVAADTNGEYGDFPLAAIVLVEVADVLQVLLWDRYGRQIGTISDGLLKKAYLDISAHDD